MEFFCQIINGKLSTTRNIDQQFNELKDGRYKVTIVSANRRSLPQNAFYWMLLTEYIQPALYDAGWEKIKTKEDAHKFVSELFLKKTEINEKTGEEIKIIRSSTELTTVEWEEYREELNRWASEYLGIVLPDPNTQSKFMYAV